MRLSGIQMRSGKSVERNIERSMRFLRDAIRKEPDMVVFPEYQMMVPDYDDVSTTLEKFEDMGGRFVSAFSGASEEFGIPLLVNAAIRYGEGRYNASILLDHGKVIYRYDKLHLFDAYSFRESAIYSKGEHLPGVYRIAGFNVSWLICYDLRFPEISRICEEKGADLIIYQAGWYSGRNKRQLWLSLLMARATETGAYVAGIGQSGPVFTGNSVVFSPFGDIIGKLSSGEGIITVDLNRSLLDDYRSEIPLRHQRRDDLYSIIHQEK